MSGLEKYNDVTSRLRRQADARERRSAGRTTTGLLREAAYEIDLVRYQRDKLIVDVQALRETHSRERIDLLEQAESSQEPSS